MNSRPTTAIRELVEQAQQHQNDLDELLDLHTDDAVIVNVAGRRVQGKQAFRDAMQQALQSPLAAVVTKTEIEDIRFVRPDVAVVSCTKHIYDQRDGASSGDPFPSSGRLTYVVVDNGDGRWRVTSAQTTPIRTS